MNDVYTVKSGDALSLIAQKHNTTEKKLLELNTFIVDRHHIEVGQKIQLPTSMQRKVINVLKKINKAIQENTPDTLPEESEVGCQKPKPIEKEEVILVVGTEEHSANYGNKMMFPAQAVREIRQNYSNLDYITILIFTDGYNSEELKEVEESSRLHNPNTNFIKINSTVNLISHINNGTKKITRLEPNSKNHLVKVKAIKFFTHGLPSILTFGYEGQNDLKQRFQIEHVSQLKRTSFIPKANIYSYACRTGNTSWDETFGNNWKNNVKPENSLAQELANHLDAKVHAYLRRSLYLSTWNDGGDKEFQKNYEQIEDESLNEDLWRPDRWDQWDEALWNDQGAYAPPTVASTPIGDIPKEMYIFEKNKEPRSK
ncbi:MAG: LysM peptidoglycan-binding domain-containing protein [bacterium]